MRRLLDRVQRVLLTGSAFLYFFTGGALLSWVILPILRWRTPPAERARRCRRALGTAWRQFHAYMRNTGLIDYDPRNVRLDLPPPPFVMVANHPTLIDVTALVSACPDVVCVSKAAMFRSPLVGRLLRYCDHVQGGDGSPFGGAAVVEGAVERLNAGISVLLFPEGTRSLPGRLGEFRHGAFEIAARANVPIVPMLVTCDPPTLLRGESWYDTPDRKPTMTVTRLPVLHPPHGEPREAARSLRATYLARLGAAPAAAGGEPISTEAPGAFAR